MSPKWVEVGRSRAGPEVRRNVSFWVHFGSTSGPLRAQPAATSDVPLTKWAEVSCPLPTSATGLYKWLVQAFLLGLLYAVLQMLPLFAIVLPGPISLVVVILSVTILIYCILITVIVRKSKNETWLRPIYSAVLLCVIINLVVELGFFIFSIFLLVHNLAGDGGVANLRTLRELRMLRVLPLVEIVCWVVCICKVRPVATSSAPVLKSDVHGPAAA